MVHRSKILDSSKSEISLGHRAGHSGGRGLRGRCWGEGSSWFLGTVVALEGLRGGSADWDGKDDGSAKSVIRPEESGMPLERCLFYNADGLGPGIQCSLFCLMTKACCGARTKARGVLETLSSFMEKERLDAKSTIPL